MVSYKTDFKMHLLKQTIKYIVPRIHRLSGDVQAKTPQSRLVLSVWARLEAVVKREVASGCWNDKNFSSLLETSKRALIFLCENDKYYKRWLGLLAMFLTEELLREKCEFTLQKALECSARPMFVTQEEFEKHRDSLFELYMTGYLYGLSLLKDENIDKIRKARLDQTHVDYPSRDPEAYFRLCFPEREKPIDTKERKE